MHEKNRRNMNVDEIVFVDGLEITRNSAGELFIEDPETRVQMRIGKLGKGGIKFTVQPNILVEPDRSTRMNGWKITPRR